MIDNQSGANYSASVNATNYDPDETESPSSTALPLWSGAYYALGFLATGAQVMWAESQAANFGSPSSGMAAVEMYLFRNNVAGSAPTNPFNAASSSYEGVQDFWGTYAANSAPTAPTIVAPSGSINTTTPTLQATHHDPDVASYGDVMTTYHVQVQRVSDGVSFWDTQVTASSSEQAASQTSLAYNGTALVPGTPYQWRAQTADWFTTWSPWSAWTAFTVNAGGTVTTAGTPTGKQLAVSGYTFQGNWTHANGLSTENVQVQLLQGGVVVQTSPVIAMTVASAASPGTAFSITWAQSGFSALQWGTAYTYQIRGEDTGNLWSPWSTPARAFTTDASPTTPTNLSPANNAPTSSPPLLTFAMTDPDDTPSPGNLTATVEIRNAGGALLATHAATSAGSGTWQYQTTTYTAEVQSLAFGGTVTGGTYTLTFGGQTTAAINWNDTAATVQARLTALSSVGSGNLTVTGGPGPATMTITFGGALYGPQPLITTTSSLTGTSPTVAVTETTHGVDGDLNTFATYQWDAYGADGTLTGPTSAVATFVYGQGPAVTVTAPAAGATVTTNTPTVTWTATGQVTSEVTISRHNTATVVYDSGVVTSPSQSLTIPSGYLHGSPATSYDVVVAVTNATPLTGSNPPQQFTVSFAAATAVAGFVASPYVAALDLNASAVLLSWSKTTYPANQFVEYVLDRRPAGTAVGTATILARLTSLATTTYVDYLPPSGQALTYGLTQVVYQGTDQTLSVRGEATVTIQLQGAVLCAATDGGTYRAVLSYPEGSDGRKVSHTRDYVTLFPWGAARPTILVGTQNYQTFSGSFDVVNDSGGTPLNYLAALRQLANPGPGVLPPVVCYRDERGRKLFGTLTAFDESDVREKYGIYLVKLELVEVLYSESVP